MTHRQHSSWKKPAAKKVTNWAAHHRNQQAAAQQAEAEGQHRPAPGLTPPLTYDEHFDLQVQRAKERQAEAEGEA